MQAASPPPSGGSGLSPRSSGDDGRQPDEARLTAVLQATVEDAARLLGADGGMIYLVAADGASLRLTYDSGVTDRPGTSWAQGLVLPIGAGLFGRAVESGAVTSTADYAPDGSFVHTAEADRVVAARGIRSMIVAPIVIDGNALGALGVFSRAPGAFSAADEALVSALAAHAGITLVNGRLIEELGRSREALAARAESERALREIGSRLASIREPSDLLQRVVDEARRLLLADGTILALLGPDQALHWSYDDGLRTRFDPDYVEALTLDVGVGVTGRAVAERRVVIANEELIDAFPRSPESDHFFEVSGFRSMIAAPIVGEAGPLGALEVYSRREGRFGQADAELISALADQAAVAITNARLIHDLATSQAQLERRAERERALRDLVAGLAALRDPNAVLQRVVDAAAGIAGADGAFLDRVTPSGSIRAGYVRGVPEGVLALVEGTEVPHGRGIMGRAIEEHRTLATDDYLADRSFDHVPDSDELARAIGIRSFIASPLIADGETIGVLAAFSGRVAAFDEEDVALIAAFTDHAAIAMSNVRLYEQLQASEARHRHLLQASPDIVFTTDTEGGFTFLSETIERLLGWQPQEMLGRHFSAIIDPSSMGDAAQRWRELSQATGDVLSARFLLIHKDGSRVPFEIRSSGLAVDGTFAGVQGAARDISASERLERELRDSEERYRYLVKASPDVVWAVDTDGRFTFLSDRLERLTGYAPEDALGHHFAELTEPEFVAPSMAVWEAVQRDPSGVYPLPILMPHREGPPVPVEVWVTGIVRDGQFAGAHGSIRDMRERHRLERELRESESRYREIVAASPDLIWETDAEGVFTFVSATIASLTGYEAEEVTGQHFRKILHPDTAADAFVAWDRLTADPLRVQPSRFSLAHRNGTAVPIENFAIARYDRGRFVGAHGAARDIRERERLERELRKSEAQYRHLVEDSPDIVWSADADGTITYMSETSEGVLGWRPDELVGQHFSIVIHPESLDYVQSQYATSLGGAGARDLRYRFLGRHRDGSPVPLEMHARTVVEDGRYLGSHGAVRDLRERERLEADLQRQAAELAASEERAHLARELHDSVTQALFSMTLVTRSVELLVQRDPAAAESKLETLRDLQRDALAEMRALIFELRPASLEAEGLARALRTHAAAVQGRTGLPVVIQASESDRLPLEIETALFRIAQEALHNIVKHAAARQARIAVERRGKLARLTVEDDGSGFDPRAVPAGHLGLDGMRARAEKLGGSLHVASRAGRGTTVRAEVPIVEPARGLVPIPIGALADPGDGDAAAATGLPKASEAGR